jgi:cell division protein ZapA (FtsZ GTPase activity inhibitor)
MTSPEDKTRITVDIYGNSYKLMASSSPNYMKRVADLVNEQMFRIARGYPRLDSQRIAVLAAVNMADENLRLIELIDELRQEHKNSADSLEEYGELQQVHDELKRMHEANLKLMQERSEEFEQDMVKVTEQNELFQEQLRAERETLKEQYSTEKEALKQQYLAEKEELLERHRIEKEELMQHHQQDEELKQELSKVQSEYRALQEEYGKLQNEYNEWIELVETESPDA